MPTEKYARTINTVKKYFNHEHNLRDENNNREDEALSRIVEYLLGNHNISLSAEFAELEEFIDISWKALVRLRWEAIIENLDGQYLRSQEKMIEAFNLGKSQDIDAWILRDIALDVRNASAQSVNNFETDTFKDMNAYSAIIKEYTSLDSCSYGDSHYRIISQGLSDEMISHFTDSPFTLRFSNDLDSVLENIALILVRAIRVGSLVSLRIAMDQLAKHVFILARISNDSKLAVRSLYLLVLLDNRSLISKVISTNWELFYPAVGEIIRLLDITEMGYSNLDKKLTKCLLIEILGSYLDDNEVSNAQIILIHYLTEELNYRGERELKLQSLKAIKSIIKRLDASQLLPTIFKAIPYEPARDEVYKICDKLDWENVGGEVLEETLDYFLSSQEKDANIPAALLRVRDLHKDIFTNVDKRMHDTWQNTRSLVAGLYLNNIVSSLDSATIVGLGKHNLDEINHRNSVLFAGSGISIYGTSEFQIISQYFTRLASINFEEKDALFNEALALFVAVLTNPYQTYSNKRDCLMAVSELAKISPKFKEKILTTIGSTLSNDESVVTGRDGSFFFDEQGSETVEMALLMTKISLELSYDIDKAIFICLESSRHKSINIRSDCLLLADTLAESPKSKRHLEQIRMLLHNMTYDEWYQIKGKSIVMLDRASNNNKYWAKISLKRMNELIWDPNSYVRSSVVYAAGRNMANKRTRVNEPYRLLLKIAQKDVHFEIREQAKRIAEDLSIPLK